MKLVIFGLSLSSSWGNGHATLWRGLLRAMYRRGHHVYFFERDVEYYASHRDCEQLPGVKLILYPDWDQVRHEAARELRDADVAIVTSYCPDAGAATELVNDSPARSRVFYDLDTPITLERVARGDHVEYIGPRGLQDFDVVLSYTGGEALTQLRERLGARRAVALYGSVDPQVHQRVRPVDMFRCDLSYLGTYAADRQQALEELFIRPAERLCDQRFLIGGAMYPQDFPWSPNIFFARHVAPCDHAEFYSSSRLTLNVTRAAMASMGYCPSGRLFEAAACGVPIITDWWEGLDQFYTPGTEILVARTTEDAVRAMQLTDNELGRISQAALEHTLTNHTADHRAAEFEAALEPQVAYEEA